MSHPRLATPALRAVLVAAIGSFGMALIGCSEQDTSAPRASLGSTDTSAVQASDTSRAAPAGQASVSLAYPTGNRSTSDLLIEEMTPREARVGRTFNYDIRVTNLRNMPITGIVLEQRIPATLQLASDANAAPDKAAENERRAKIEVGDLGPNESKMVQMAGTPTQQGTIDTCLSARYNAPRLCAMVNVVAPSLSVTAQGPSQADICQDLEYQYNVTNTGSGTSRNVVLEENLPDGLRTADGQGSIAINIGDLTAGQTKTVKAHLKAAQPGNFTTQAFARSDDTGRAQAQQIATAVLAPRLAVTVVGPKEEYLGEPLIYQVTVKNGGDAPAAATKVRLGATAGAVSFVSAQNADGSKLTEERPGAGSEIGTLAPGESRTVAITFTSQQEGDLTFDATAEAKCAMPVTTPVNTHIRTITASALIVTHDPDPVRVGSDVIYHITVQNKGTAADHNVNVSVALPGSEQFVKGTGGTAATADGQTITFAAIPELAPKQVVTWDVRAKAMKAEEAQLKVTMTSTANKTAAVKIEPTKLYGDIETTQEKTNIAPKPAPLNPAIPTPPTPDVPNK